MNTQTATVTPRWRSLVVTRAVLATVVFLLPVVAQAGLTLPQAIDRAHQHDPWLRGSTLRQQALDAQRVAAGSLPDPVVSVGLANLPLDTLDFSQEPMTQFRIGLSQRIPRGDSRALQQRRLQLLGGQHPHQREDRRARIAVQVAQLWLEAYRARESIRLIEQHRSLFEHLVDVAQSSYATAVGRTRQQDLVRAQLELTLLEDRLAVLHQQQETAHSALGEWLSVYPVGAADRGDAGGGLELAESLPDIALRHPGPDPAGLSVAPEDIAPYLQQHPVIRNLDSRIAASETGIALAEQNYRPQWQLNASYGYRDDDPFGNQRADFFSVGVAFDLPLFTSRRQDPQLQSAVAGTEALRTEKSLALRALFAAFDTQRARLQRLEQRRELYRSRLLEEMHEQAEAALTAYTNDDGDFAEVVRARIAELNARIDALDIDVQRLQAISELNYFFAASGNASEGES